jgi:diguanylate cyclase (GGDEF)-like protein/PAS domain S-box-containing protein
VTLKSISDAVITTDIHGVIDFINPMAEKLTGWQLEEVRGQSINKIFKIVDEENLRQAVNPIYRCIVKDKVTDYDHVLLINRNGVHYCIQDSAAPIHDSQGKIQGAVLVFNDETQARKLNQNLLYQTTHDSLTGLVNRKFFEEQLERLLVSLRLSGGSHIFCYLLLEPFKMINDTCGHTASDELLKQVTGILQSKLRACDTLARLGWDEFGILMEHCPLERAICLATVLRKTLANYHFVWRDKHFAIEMNIRTIPLTDQFSSLDDLLFNA